jgi:hypothetical protein
MRLSDAGNSRRITENGDDLSNQSTIGMPAACGFNAITPMVLRFQPGRPSEAIDHGRKCFLIWLEPLTGRRRDI